MRTTHRFALSFAAILLSVGCGTFLNAGTLVAQETATRSRESSAQDKAGKSSGKKVLTIDDYERWNRVRSANLSADGKWVTYTIAPNDGDATLYLESTSSDDKQEIKTGGSPQFSKDSQWFIYSVEKGEGGGRGNSGSRRTVLMNLESKEKTEWTNATSVRFTDDSKYLTFKKPRQRDANHAGADLILYNLQSGLTRHFGAVNQYSFNEDGNLLAYTVDAADDHGNGLYLFELETNLIRSLDSSRQTYSQLTWNEAGTHLAVLRGETPEGKQRRQNTLLVFHNFVAGVDEPISFEPDSQQSFPEGMVLSELARLTWSADASMVFCGIREQEDKPEKGGSSNRDSDDKRPNVDVWHWKDEDVQSVQQRRAAAAARRTIPGVVHITNQRFVQLGDDAMERVTIVGDGRWGIGRDDSLYAGEITWGGSRADYYRVDLKTGERTLITSALGRPMGTSPDGRHYLYLKGGQVLVYDLDEGTSRNLSLSTRVNFVNEEDDHPYEKPAYGVAGWTSDGRSVILNHKFDLWLLPLDGSTGSCLTGNLGETEQIVFRYRNLDPDAEGIDLAQPMLLSAYGEWTKKSGYYSLRYGEQPQPLVFDDVRFGTPNKAENSDEVLITRETFVDFPDYYLTSTKFDNFERITEANPQQSEFTWGPKRVLVDYENADGVRLQGTLALPADYEEGKQYPMLVYFYEKMSNRHHQHSAPSFDDRPHMCTYASDGYLVLMPDVIYKTGRPGDCAVDCVTSAVKKVIDLGYADPERIALQGHSWGGYQSSFILTQTDMFCCVVTGAPVTNLISFYNELYKSSGSVQQGITERGQVRMGTTPWDNFELFQSQSPLHNVRNITTPFIILHGTDDGAVDWHQGLEYYNAAKRNGKEVILLSYPGEGHHLAQRANQVDFQVRMKQFFDHYCKDSVAPDWMTNGVPHLEKDTASPRPEGKTSR
ncbi:MAG: prolyl oligopeptidase family serine peptidase [Pirellulales bacterium]|nr:prolyl oligopeptidase family serine peptidase [Pirellulales bacterium]